MDAPVMWAAWGREVPLWVALLPSMVLAVCGGLALVRRWDTPVRPDAEEQVRRPRGRRGRGQA